MLRRPKGTYVRNSWDWLRHGNAVAVVADNIPALGEYICFLNSGAGQDAYDLYRLEVELSAAAQISVEVGQFSGATTTPSHTEVSAIDPGSSPPAAQMVACAATNFKRLYTLKFANANLTSYVLDLNAGPFTRLWAGYALGVRISAAGGLVGNFNLFFQSIAETHQ